MALQSYSRCIAILIWGSDRTWFQAWSARTLYRMLLSNPSMECTQHGRRFHQVLNAQRGQVRLNLRFITFAWLAVFADFVLIKIFSCLHFLTGVDISGQCAIRCVCIAWITQINPSRMSGIVVAVSLCGVYNDCFLSRPHILSGIGLSGSISQYSSLVHYYMLVAYSPYLWLLETKMYHF